MRIGYAGLNYSVDCTPSSTFRLKSYSTEKLKNKIKSNLNCLEKILSYNLKHDILFFRIGSGVIPFASHEVFNFNWQKEFSQELKKIGNFIKKNNFRITMHPGPYTILNSLKQKVVDKAVKELQYHDNFLTSLGLNSAAKINIHVGGVYDDKEKSLQRFIKNYHRLPVSIKKRLVIENDEKSYNFSDCLKINKKTGIPLTMDVLHYQIKNETNNLKDSILKAVNTWGLKDGLPVIHYSSQDKNKQTGAHAPILNEKDFIRFLKTIKGIRCDVILEIKDKEKSAQKAVKILKNNEKNK